MKLSHRIVLIILFTVTFFGYGMLPSFRTTNVVGAQDKVFTLEELSQYDGKDGHKAYYAYEGKVYDVTGSKMWEEGEHFGLHAGEDLTGKMEDAPHGTEVFAGFEVMGTYKTISQTTSEGDQPETPREEKSMAGEVENNEISEPQWFEQRIRPLGISILGWTGIFLGVFFILTFATCFAMPWAKLRLPWKGQRPGPDPLDNAPNHMAWTSVHKYFVWFTVVLGIIHGILGVMQFFGIYL